MNRKKEIALRFVSVIACLLLSALAAFGQGDLGSITGTITDPQGASTPNAGIDVKNVDTNVVSHGTSNNAGNYLIPVPAGKYQVTITAMGFKKYVRENVQVQVASGTRVDVKLALGETNDTITITDEAPLLKTESGEISHTISTDDVDQLPVMTTAGGSWFGATGLGNIRNPLQEAILLPGVVFQNDNTLVVNGLPSNSESIRTEGQDSTSTIWKVEQQISQGGMDAIQEVAIQTSNFAAEYGQAAGGYFNYTMKSGTNKFHGSAYDYFVNEALNAGEPFTNAGLTNSLKDGQLIRNTVRRNDFGGTFGGPVVIPKLYDGKNKTFFFVNFERFVQAANTSGALATVPTLAYRSGNFNTAGCFFYVGGTDAGGGVCAAPGGGLVYNSTAGALAGKPATDPAGQNLAYGEVFDPATTHLVGGQQVRTPFMNQQIPISRIDPATQAIQNLMPLPNQPGLENNYIIPTYSNYMHTTNFSVKMDQAISPTIKISGYYSQLLTYSPNSNGFAGSTLALAGATPEDNWNHTIRLNYDQTISPTLLLHIGIGWFDTSSPNIAPAYNQTQLGFSGYYDTNLFPTIGGLTDYFSGGWGPGFGALGGAFTAEIWEQKPTATASLTHIYGNHTLKYGAEYVQEGFPERSDWRANGNFAFSNAETSDPWQNGQPLNYPNASGYTYASFFLGLPDTGTLSPTTSTKLGDHSMGFFAQDTWKITHKLTLDFGLRYDYETYMKESYGRMQDASFVTPDANAGGRDGAVVYEATCGCSFSHNYPYAFGPRIGAAYQLDSKTVLRGGAGVQYDATEAPNGISYSTADYYNVNPTGYGISPFPAGYDANPYAPGNSYGNAPLTWPNFNESKYPTFNAGLAAPNSPFNFFDPHNRPGRIFTWSLGVQREVIKNLLVEASYVGNRGAYFPAPDASIPACNCLTPSGLLSTYGLNMASASDRALLTDQLTNPAVQARFPQFALVNVNGIPTVPSVYPGFPAAQTLAQALRGVPQWDALTPWLGPPLGDTWYDSLQVKVTKRFSHGLQAQGNYVWAKGLANGATSDSTYFLAGVADSDIYNPGLNKQINTYVRPQALTVTFTYTTPKWNAAGFGMKALSQAARDWQIGAVLRYQSGAYIESPTSLNSLTAQLLRNQGSVAANNFQTQVPGVPLLLVNPNCGCFNPQTAQVLNPAAWVDAPGGTWGTAAPYYSNYRWQRQPAESASLARNFRVGKEGKYVLQIRAEMYNVFNRLFLPAPSTGNPGACLTGTCVTTGTYSGNIYNTGGYGTLATSGGAGAQPRNGQLVARFTF